MTILVVDDDLRILNMTADVLRDQGLDVVQAASGTAALQLLATTPGIDLLLSDVLMPGQTGPNLADAATAIYPHLRVVFMSGDTGGIPPAAFKGRTVVAKPFTIATLLSAIEQA